MGRWTISLTLAVPLLIACAPAWEWVKAGATHQDFDRDSAQRKYEAASATASYGSTPTARSPAAAAGHGFGEGIAIALRQSELETLCLQARGYWRRPLR